MIVLVFTACRPAPNEPPGTAASSIYFAEYSEPCGRSILKISKTENGPATDVQPVGEESPIVKLRYHALLTGRFKIWGTLTGVERDDGHCGSYPEFRVTKFEAWDEVKRCTSVGSLNADLHYFTENQPTDRFVSSDFRGQAPPPQIDMESCVERESACEGNRTDIRSCDGVMWCCNVVLRPIE